MLSEADADEKDRSSSVCNSEKEDETSMVGGSAAAPVSAPPVPVQVDEGVDEYSDDAWSDSVR